MDIKKLASVTINGGKVAKVITGGKNEAAKVDSLKAKEAFGSGGCEFGAMNN